MTLDPQKRGVDDHNTVEALATTSEGTSPFDVTQILYIHNPGPADIVFNVDRLTTDRGKFTVEADETWGPVGRTCSNLHYKLATGFTDPQRFRAFGLKGPG